MNIHKHPQSGFTLLEILLVVAAIAILAGIVIFAINPSKQLGDTRNAQRKVDVNTILNAVYQYSLDNGSLPSGIPVGTESDALHICQTDATCDSDYLDLPVLTDNSKYIVSIPIDPSAATDDDTEYAIYIDSNNRVHVLAPNAENSITIEVIR